MPLYLPVHGTLFVLLFMRSRLGTANIPHSDCWETLPCAVDKWAGSELQGVDALCEGPHIGRTGEYRRPVPLSARACPGPLPAKGSRIVLEGTPARCSPLLF